jgi:hypothetical protein
MSIERWENEGGFIQMTHSYFDRMGFEETHEGSQTDCPTKQCRKERAYYRRIPAMDPWPDGSGPYGTDPWMQEGI